MLIPFSKKTAIVKIKEHDTFKTLSSRKISTANIEALVGYIISPTTMSDAEVAEIGRIIFFYNITFGTSLCLRWPNGAYLAVDSNAKDYHWITEKDLNKWNRSMN